MESLEIEVPLVNKNSKETIEQSSINTNSNIITTYQQKTPNITTINNTLSKESNSGKTTSRALNTKNVESTKPETNDIKPTIIEYHNDELINTEEPNNVIINDIKDNESCINQRNCVINENNLNDSCYNEYISDEEEAIKKFSYKLQHSKRKQKNISMENNNNNNSYIIFLKDKEQQQKIRLRYQTELAKLKCQIKCLEKESDNIKKKLNEAQVKHEELIYKQQEKEQNEEQIITNISSILGISSINDIIPQLKIMLNQINKRDSLLTEDLIDKIKDLYINLSQTYEKKHEIEISTIIKWIKHLLNTINILNEDKENNLHILSQLKNNNKYKNYCEQIIQEYKLQNIDELKSFIEELLNINSIYKKRVHKLKRVLLDNPNKSEF